MLDLLSKILGQSYSGVVLKASMDFKRRRTKRTRRRKRKAAAEGSGGYSLFAHLEEEDSYLDDELDDELRSEKKSTWGQ